MTCKICKKLTEMKDTDLVDLEAIAHLFHKFDGKIETTFTIVADEFNKLKKDQEKINQRLDDICKIILEKNYG